MYVIGLTGGIASGKSLVAGFLKQLGAEIVDADSIGHQVIEPGSPAYDEILEVFGNNILQADKQIDRRKLGAIVFSCPEKLRILNRITHPRILLAIEECLDTIREKRPQATVVVEAALLLETGLKDLADEIWTVEADPEIQVKRLIENRGLTEEDAWERIRSQAPSGQRIAYADRVVYNNAGVEELFQEILEIWGSNQK